MAEPIDAKRAQHAAFWRGEGPSLILIPPGQQDLYDLADYPARYRNPQAMWHSEIARAEPVLHWPTDGVPTVRPNLGVTFIPAMAGLPYQVVEGNMPWPGEPLPREAIRAARAADLAHAETMRLAAEFYALHRESGRTDIVAYHADTQGVFDIAHMLYGSETFYEMTDPDQAGWIKELFDVCHALYCRATEHVKSMLDEPARAMTHGHGTSQGVFFPASGARMSEDTATLLSPAMIDVLILPAIERAAAPFGTVFLHFCGKHDVLFERLCQSSAVCAIDLGNPEMHDTRWLMERCAATGTVLHSRLAAEPGEDWQTYTRRLAGLVRATGARCILRPVVFPESRREAAEMQDLWHQSTNSWSVP